jgi:hypothetical protein
MNDIHGMGNEEEHNQRPEIIEASISLLLAVRLAPENRKFRQEIDQEIEWQKSRLEKK